MSLDLEIEPPHCVGIVGASARAAAFSAIRAGLTPFCWDLFGDSDLLAVAETEPLAALDDEAFFSKPARQGLPLLQTGGMENHLQWIVRAATTGPVWGNNADVVRRVRDPFEVQSMLTPLRLPIPDLRAFDEAPPTDGNWLLKPIHGAGGRGIVRWTPEAVHHPTLEEPHYYQRLIEGESYSAVFVGLEPPGDVNFVGISRQLVGWDALHAPPYAWCGSVGPASLEVPTEHLIRRFGNVLMWKFQLRGLFGCDFIVDRDGQPWLIEINPRYPASAELFELACGFTLLRSHAAAFGVTWRDPDADFDTFPESVIAKGVVYAPQDFVMPALDPHQIATPTVSVNRVADVPRAGARIRKGHPVCTFLVEGLDDSLATERLISATREFLAAAIPEA